MTDQFEEVNAVADVIGAAIAKHYKGDVNVYPTLGALSTIAADIISKAPPQARAELLEAWAESPAWVRASLGQKN